MKSKFIKNIWFWLVSTQELGTSIDKKKSIEKRDEKKTIKWYLKTAKDVTETTTKTVRSKLQRYGNNTCFEKLIATQKPKKYTLKFFNNFWYKMLIIWIIWLANNESSNAYLPWKTSVQQLKCDKQHVSLSVVSLLITFSRWKCVINHPLLPFVKPNSFTVFFLDSCHKNINIIIPKS